MKEQFKSVASIIEQTTTSVTRFEPNLMQSVYCGELTHLRSILEKLHPSCPFCGAKMVTGVCGISTCGCREEGLGKVLLNLTGLPVKGYTANGNKLPLKV